VYFYKYLNAVGNEFVGFPLKTVGNISSHKKIYYSVLKLFATHILLLMCKICSFHGGVWLLMTHVDVTK